MIEHMEKLPQSFEKQPSSNKQGFNLEISQRFLKIDNEDKLLEELYAVQWANREKLGQGYNAEVYPLFVDGEKSSLCVKKIKKLPESKVNSIYEEAEFQAKAHMAGVRTPRYVMALKDTKNNQEYVVMERIDGYSVVDCLSAETGSQPHELFSTVYSHEKFFAELHSMVNKMHEAKIHHRDLHSGNVMIGNDGMPVIIDFGTATYSYGMHEDKDIYLVEGQTLVDRNTQKYQFIKQIVNTDNQKIEILAQHIKKNL